MLTERVEIPEEVEVLSKIEPYLLFRREMTRRGYGELDGEVKSYRKAGGGIVIKYVPTKRALLFKLFERVEAPWVKHKRLIMKGERDEP